MHQQGDTSMDNLKGILRNVMLFASLTEDELEQVGKICSKRILHRGDLIAKQGEPGDESVPETQEQDGNDDDGGDAPVCDG